MKSLLLLILVAAALVIARTDEVPIVGQRCTDLTETLNPVELRSLNLKLERFEQQTSNQIVVLMVKTTGEEPIEEYTLRVAEANKLGRKGRDNGVLFVIAKDDHNMRIEVGYGLEGALPDAISNQIIRNIVAPRFRAGSYYDGINAGTDSIFAATKGEFTGDGPGAGSNKKRSNPLFVIIIMIVLSILLRGLRGGRRYVGSGGVWGGLGGGSFGGGGGFGGGGFSGGGGSFGGGGSSGSW